MTLTRLIALLAVLGTLAWADLDAVKKEPSLEKRAELAIENADQALTRAKSASTEGDFAKVSAALEETAASCELALESLRDTGKKPSKLSKQYKQDEIRTRQFLRRLDGVIGAVNLDDRPKAEGYRDRVTTVHEEFLLGVMSRN
jgi:hypothetical protein